MDQYSLRTLIESADAFELMRKHRPTDELAEWAKSNVEGGSMSAMAVSDLLSVTVNGVPLKSIEARTRSSIEQWIGNGWWKQVNWDAYEASGDPNDFFDLEMYPKQVSPNTFSIKPKPARAKEWQLDTNPDGSYTVEFESYTKTKDDDLANEIHDQLMKWTDSDRGRNPTVKDLNRKFMSKYSMFLSNPRVQQEIEDWNNLWQGWPIQMQESKRNNKMKITKRQLKRIIKEEKQKLLREGQSQEETLFDALDQYVMVLDEEMGYDVPREELKAEVLNFVDGYFEDSAYAAELAREEEKHAATRPWEHN